MLEKSKHMLCFDSCNNCFVIKLKQWDTHTHTHTHKDFPAESIACQKVSLCFCDVTHRILYSSTASCYVTVSYTCSGIKATHNRSQDSIKLSADDTANALRSTKCSPVRNTAAWWCGGACLVHGDGLLS
jgi:hypothetical protein